MPLLGGFGVGRWFGFPIRIDYSWFLVVALVVWTFSTSWFPVRAPGYADGTYLGMGVAAALLFFLSVLLHELAHSLVARSRGIPVEGITLFIFGGIAQAREEAKRPLDEFLLTIAGPLCSLALSGAFYGIAAANAALGGPQVLGTIASTLGLLNLVLAIFNMIPGFPLDGGRIFRSIAWAATGDLGRATRWATWGGRAFGGVLILYGLTLLAMGALLEGLWSAFIGWFLATAAASSYRQFQLRQVLSRIPVSRVMRPEPPAVPPDLSVQRLIDDFFARRPEQAYPVVLDGAVLGLVGVSDVAAVPRLERGVTTAAQVMRPTYEIPVARWDESLADLVGKLEPGVEPNALVLDGPRLVGFVSVGDLRGWIERLRRLGIEDPEPDSERPARATGAAVGEVDDGGLAREA